MQAIPVQNELFEYAATLRWRCLTYFVKQAKRYIIAFAYFDLVLTAEVSGGSRIW